MNTACCHQEDRSSSATPRPFLALTVRWSYFLLRALVHSTRCSMVWLQCSLRKIWKPSMTWVCMVPVFTALVSASTGHHQQSDIISQTAVLTAMGHKSNASQDALCLKTSVTKHLVNKVATCGSITCALVPAMCTQAGICLDGSLAAHITWLYQCNVERKKRKRKYYAFRHRLKKSPRMRYIGLPCSAR